VIDWSVKEESRIYSYLRAPPLLSISFLLQYHCSTLFCSLELIHPICFYNWKKWECFTGISWHSHFLKQVRSWHTPLRPLLSMQAGYQLSSGKRCRCCLVCRQGVKSGVITAMLQWNFWLQKVTNELAQAVVVVLLFSVWLTDKLHQCLPGSWTSSLKGGNVQIHFIFYISFRPRSVFFTLSFEVCSTMYVLDTIYYQFFHLYDDIRPF